MSEANFDQNQTAAKESIIKTLSTSTKDIPYKTTQKFLKLTIEKVWGNKFKVSGQENVPVTGSAIIAFNHPSYFDEPFLMAAINRSMHFIGRQQRSFNPFYVRIGYSLLRVIGASKNLKEDKKRFFKRIDQVVKDKELIAIAPEILDQEEKTEGEVVGEFARGVVYLAKKYNLPVIPVSVHGTLGVKPNNTKGISPIHIKPVEIVIGKPIPAGEIQNAEQIRQAIIGLKNQANSNSSTIK